MSFFLLFFMDKIPFDLLRPLSGCEMQKKEVTLAEAAEGIFEWGGGQTNLRGPLNRRDPPLGTEGPPEAIEGALVNNAP